MKKLIVASSVALAVLGLAACSDTDESTTQGVPPAEQQQEPMATPPATQPAEPAPAN